VRVIFSPASWEDYVAWQAENAGTADRINSLIREILNDLLGNVSWTRRPTSTLAAIRS
jgi:Txe/YoeB family toxin of Txe-Axe toxin-antitoxin module